MKKYLILLLLASFSVEAQIVNIPDANFKAKLLEASPSNTIAQSTMGQYFKIDVNNDGEIQESEALLVRNLNVSNSNISSLEGITSFLNIIDLNASYNNLTTVNLSGLSFWKINLEFNQLNSISVTDFQNTYINVFKVNNNQLESFDFFEVFGNNSIDLLIDITELDISNNPIDYFNFDFNYFEFYVQKLKNQSLKIKKGNHKNLRG